MALPFKKEVHRSCTIIFIFFLVLFQQPDTPLASKNFVGSACLQVSPSEFAGAAKEVLTILDKVSSILSRFSGKFGNVRLAFAIADCLDLIDLSSDVLAWAIAAAQNPHGKHNSTGNLSSDLRTWLSAVLSHPETCIEGFEGTNRFVKGLVSSGLTQVISLAKHLLTQVHPVSDQFAASKGKFPSWVKPEDRKLLEANGVTVDAVVAADGSGDFTKVMDAVLAAPDYSMKRYVIYVKKGVYLEYVEIKKKKWNIMMIGDGMDLTVISGNRNHVDGWTTFRSPTFAVSGRGFIARDISFEKTAGPEKHQAVALRSDSDLSVFYRCGIFGYQDSLYTHTMRQFYRECKITGTVDFIFEDATAVFQNCQLKARKGLSKVQGASKEMLKDIDEETDKDPIINAAFQSVVGERSGYCRGLRAGIKPTNGKSFTGLHEQLASERQQRENMEIKLKEVENQLQEERNMREEMTRRFQESQKQLEEGQKQLKERMDKQFEEKMKAFFLQMCNSSVN